MNVVQICKDEATEKEEDIPESVVQEESTHAAGDGNPNGSFHFCTCNEKQVYHHPVSK